LIKNQSVLTIVIFDISTIIFLTIWCDYE